MVTQNDSIAQACSLVRHVDELSNIWTYSIIATLCRYHRVSLYGVFMSQLFLCVLFLGPLFAVLGIMKVWNIRMQRSGRQFQLQDEVLREPGYTLQKKREEVWDQISQYLFLLPIYPLVMYSAFLQTQVSGKSISWLVITIITLSIVLLLAFSYQKIWSLLNLSHQLKLGYAGEVAVGQELNTLLRYGFLVFHDVQFEGFNVDHIAVGSTGIFSIETKMRTKRLSGGNEKSRCEVRYDGEALYFHDNPKNAYSQALHQASNEARSVSKWLSRATGRNISAQPVLALPGWWIDDKDSKSGEVWVFNHKKLYRLTEPTSSKLSKSEIESIGYQISQRCIRDDIKPKALIRKERSLFQCA